MWEAKLELPPKIEVAVKKLKEECGCYIAVRKIGNGYYLYKEWKVWDLLHKKQKLKTEYMGRITPEGAFRKSAISYKLNLENAIKLIESEGGIVTMHADEGRTAKTDVEQADRSVLTCLSMNSRLPAKRMANISGISSGQVYNRIKNLEKKYGIEYTAQFYVPAIGYRSYMIFIKFIDDKPGTEELKMVFSNEPKIQYAVLTKGEYDVIAYMLDTSSLDAEKTVIKLRESTILSKYKEIVYTSPLAQKYGYIHLRDEFFDAVLKGRIWHRTKNSKSRELGELLEREFLVLRELNSYGNIDFPDIDRKYDLGRGASFYTYKKLKESGIISTTTINMRSSNVKYFGIMIIKRITMSQYAKTSHHLYADVVNDMSYPINKYALICEVGAPDSVVVFAPVVGIQSIDEMASVLRAKLQGVEISTSIVTSSLVGNVCLRKFDNSYAMYYTNLIESKRLKQGNRTDYN